MAAEDAAARAAARAQEFFHEALMGACE
jgi:hypothetical protein